MKTHEVYWLNELLKQKHLKNKISHVIIDAAFSDVKNTSFSCSYYKCRNIARHFIEKPLLLTISINCIDNTFIVLSFQSRKVSVLPRATYSIPHVNCPYQCDLK